MNRGLWFASLILVILGLISLIAGVVMSYYDNEREEMKGRVTAKVVELVHREQNGPYRNIYFPVLEFYAKGQLYKIVHPYGSYPCEYHIGQEVKLCYDINRPENYRLADSSLRKMLPGILKIAGVVSLVLAVFIFIRFAARG